ncbi:MAG: ATP-binding protein [Bacteroidales bacterium]
MVEPVIPSNPIPSAQYHDIMQPLRSDGLPWLVLTSGVVGVLIILLGAGKYYEPWQSALIGLLMVIFSSASYWMLAHYYRTSVWLVCMGWGVGITTAAVFLPRAPVICLFALPVGMATFFLNTKGGVFTGVLISVGLYLGSRFSPGFVTTPENVLISLFSVWGTFFLVWIALRPTQLIVTWYCESYADARRELEAVRDTQAELKQAVKDLADANAQMSRLNLLLHAARNAAEQAERVKAEFVANVSHELRTPLSLIIGFSETILNAPATYGAKLPPMLLADIAAIHRNSQHLINLINDVLDVSQIEANFMRLNKEWVELPEMIDSAFQAIEPLVNTRGLYLRVEKAEDLPPVYCDRTRVRQVLLNLINNAIRFTKEGGITLCVEVEEQQVKFRVKDTGIGITEQDLAKLFQPFLQVGPAKGSQGSSGLGLHISRRLVELHHGRMGAESTLEEGSTFWFTLPLSQQSAESNSYERWLNTNWEPKRHSRLTPRKPLSPRLVVLEADPLLADLGSQVLERVEIQSAASPEQAKAILDAAPAQALMIRGDDPQQTRQWVEWVKDNRFVTPVVACSYTFEPVARTMGITAYLTKPVTHQQLLAEIFALPKPVRTILLVDDNSESLQLYTRILSAEPYGYRVIQAANGLEAMELLRARRPDVLVLDWVMPEMDGEGVIRQKNEDARLRDIPVIVLSAQDPPSPPVTIPQIQIFHGNGLSVPQIMRCALAVSEILWGQTPMPDPGQTEVPLDLPALPDNL